MTVISGFVSGMELDSLKMSNLVKEIRLLTVQLSLYSMILSIAFIKVSNLIKFCSI